MDVLIKPPLPKPPDSISAQPTMLGSNPRPPIKRRIFTINTSMLIGALRCPFTSPSGFKICLSSHVGKTWYCVPHIASPPANAARIWSAWLAIVLSKPFLYSCCCAGGIPDILIVRNIWLTASAICWLFIAASVKLTFHQASSISYKNEPPICAGNTGNSPTLSVSSIFLTAKPSTISICGMMETRGIFMRSICTRLSWLTVRCHCLRSKMWKPMFLSACS